MRFDNSIPCGYNLSRKRGTPIDGAPSYTKLSEKITAKFGRLGGLFLFCDDVCSQYNVNN